MINRARKRLRCQRPGTSAVELAVLLPFLAFMFLITVDFARIFYYSLTINNCARNGAVFASQVFNSQTWQNNGSSISTVQQAALADGSSLNPPLASSNVIVANGTDGNGNANVTVTVNYTFQTIATYPGIPSTTNLSRQVEMRVGPQYPN